jgi:hypothetical protein
MSAEDPDLRKTREIRFQFPHSDPNQAGTAALLLEGVEGVGPLEVVDPAMLRVGYDLRCVTLRELECALEELGFHLDNSLMSKLRRAIWYFADDTQRANLGCERDSNCTRRVFVNRYQLRFHGCRDERPEHWRQYL